MELHIIIALSPWWQDSLRGPEVVIWVKQLFCWVNMCTYIFTQLVSSQQGSYWCEESEVANFLEAAVAYLPKHSGYFSYFVRQIRSSYKILCLKRDPWQQVMPTSEVQRQLLAVTGYSLEPCCPLPCTTTLLLSEAQLLAQFIGGHSPSVCTGGSNILGSWLTGWIDLALSPSKSSTSRVGFPAYLKTWALGMAGGGSINCVEEVLWNFNLGANCIWGFCYKYRFPVPYLFTVIQNVWYSNSEAQ